jgi:hypothetical protein
MNRTTKKRPPKAAQKRAVKDLEVRPAQREKVRGGFGAASPQNIKT